MKRTIRTFLNKRGYEIIKQDYIGDKFPNLSKENGSYFCETPIGNYYLPLQGLEQDAVANMLVRGKYFDKQIIEIAKKYIKENTAVLDIGANFGQMSIEFSKAVGPAGKVYSFEAQDVVFRLLQKNIEANKCTNVELINRAIWDKENITLYFPEPNMSGPAPYSGNYVTEAQKASPVQSVTIDSLNIPEPISFMKIDIEGADIFALRGAQNTILKNKMPVIFEFSQHVQADFNTSFQDYVSFTESINYQFAEIVMEYNYLIIPK